MSKKNLQVAGIMNELQGASLFFTQSTPVSPPLPSVTKEKEQKIPEITVSPNVEVPEIAIENTGPAGGQTPKRSIEPNNETTKQPINEQTNERTRKRILKRRKIRHTFDIFADQLMSLREISLEEEKYIGERVLLGDLAQQALDMFITKYRNKE